MNNRKRSQKQENRVAREIGGERVLMSGGAWDRPGDVKSGKFLIECKTTGKNTYPLKAATWEKIEREALREGMRIPLMYIDLRNGITKCIVFSEHAFDCELVEFEDFSADLTYMGNSQFTITEDSVWRGVKISVCGNKENVLYCLSLSKFKELFKEEIPWQG